MWGGIPAAKRREAHGKCSFPPVVLFAGCSQEQRLGSGRQAEREGGSCTPKFPTCVAVAAVELGAAELERCCRGLSAAGRALGAHWGSLERRGTEAPVPRLCPPALRPPGGGGDPAGRGRRGHGADPAALPAARGGAASEAAPGWEWGVPPGGFPV